MVTLREKQRGTCGYGDVGLHPRSLDVEGSGRERPLLPALSRHARNVRTCCAIVRWWPVVSVESQVDVCKPHIPHTLLFLISAST